MIGVFDSGLGGLTALREIRAIMPDADLIYFGDTARMPYGARSKEVINRYALQDCAMLVSLNVDIILAACGTVSSNALPLLRSRFTTPIYGVVEGAAETAVRVASQGNGRILVLGTEATVSSGAFEKAIRALDKDVEIDSVACPMFAPMAENWRTDPNDSACRAIAAEYLTPVSHKEHSAVILGCTHYPLLAGLISLFLPRSQLISSGKEAADLLLARITEKGINIHESGSTVFYTSDDPGRFSENAGKFLGSEISGNVIRTNVETIGI